MTMGKELKENPPLESKLHISSKQEICYRVTKFRVCVLIWHRNGSIQTLKNTQKKNYCMESWIPWKIALKVLHCTKNNVSWIKQQNG